MHRADAARVAALSTDIGYPSSSEEVERWTREHGFAVLRVRVNRTREEAGSFYRGVGFERIKVQNVFQRQLKQGTPDE